MIFSRSEMISFLSPAARATIGLARNCLLPAMPHAWQRRLPPKVGCKFDIETIYQGSRQRPSGLSIPYFETVTSRNRRTPAAAFPTRWSVFESHYATHPDPLFVATLRGARVSGRFPAVTTVDSLLFTDVSRVHSEPVDTHPVYRRLRLPRPTLLTGKTLLLCGAWAGSFYHWMVDQLPRLALLDRAHMDLASFDHVLLPEANGPFLLETLSLFSELKAHRHTLDDAAHFECDELVCPSFPHRVGEADPWGPIFVTKHILGHDRAEIGNRRFLISRSRAPRRRLKNEEDLWQNVLAHLGFERLYLEEHSVQEQAQLIAVAAFIVAPHGAGLTNLIFAPKHCCIIELLNSNYPATCFWHLSDELGLDYRYIVGGPEKPALNDSAGQHTDFSVDPRLVANCLKDLPCL